MSAQAHIFTGTEISTGRRKPSEIVAEYDAKREALAGALAEFEAAGTTLKTAATIGGTWGNVTLDTGRGIYPSVLEVSLLQSAWRHVYDLYGLDQIASASARYDHSELDDLRPHWDDLPVGSFSESGTNINTTVATIYADTIREGRGA